MKKAGTVVSEASTDTYLFSHGILAIVSEAPTDTGTDAILAIVSEGPTSMGSVAPTVKGFAEGDRSASWILMRLMVSSRFACVMGSVAPILAVAAGRCVLS